MNDTVSKSKTKNKAKKRLNITLTPDLEFALTALAKRNGVPKSKVAVSLLEDAVEIVEDQIWAELAEERRRNTKPEELIPHDEFWTKVQG